MLVFHRKEQFDIAANGIKNPIVVIAWQSPGEYSRLFCLWSGGVWLRWFGNVRLCWQWGKGGLTQRALDVLPCGHTLEHEHMLIETGEFVCDQCGAIHQ